MTIAAANVLPNFGLRRKLDPKELMQLQEPACIFEGEHVDSDGFRVFLYTVGGWLNGENVATIQGGATVGGDVMMIEAENRQAADDMACRGLEDTLSALRNESTRELDALAARARLESVGGARRMELAIKPDADKSSEYEEDMAKIRPLVGDDIILTTGLH